MTQELPAVFVLRVCLIDVEALDIELLMYHSLKVCDFGNAPVRRTDKHCPRGRHYFRPLTKTGSLRSFWIAPRLLRHQRYRLNG